MRRSSPPPSFPSFLRFLHQPFIFLQAWPTVTNPASCQYLVLTRPLQSRADRFRSLSLLVAQLSPSHLLTLGLPSHDPDESPDAPLASINLTKVRMAKAGMRDAKLVGVTEVQGGNKEEEDVELEEKERENAWVRVCLREALGQSLSLSEIQCKVESYLEAENLTLILLSFACCSRPEVPHSSHAPHRTPSFVVLNSNFQDLIHRRFNLPSYSHSYYHPRFPLVFAGLAQDRPRGRLEISLASDLVDGGSRHPRLWEGQREGFWRGFGEG